MDDFIREAFEKAEKVVPVFEKTRDEFYENSPTILSYVIDTLGEERAKSFLGETMEKYGEELLIFAFTFYSAGKLWESGK